MLNPQFNYRAPQALVVPQGNAGWQTIGTLWNGAAGLMTYLDAKKRAEKMDKAQNDYYEALKAYLNKDNDSAATETTPAATTAPETISNTTEPENNAETYQYTPYTTEDNALNKAIDAAMAEVRNEEKLNAYERAMKNLQNKYKYNFYSGR